MSDLERELLDIFGRKGGIDAEAYAGTLREATSVLAKEDPARRPYDSSDRPGGLVLLRRDASTIIVPDLHARMDFLLAVLLPNLERMRRGELQVVCVGDGFHSEERGRERWKEALEEYKGGFRRRTSMDAEMAESLGVMEMAMRAKIRFPGLFHFLKGNHENVTNERGEGNYPFAKYAMEGPMVTAYVKAFLGEDFLSLYSSFEKSLPLLAAGRNFLVSHAEPGDFFDRERIVEYRSHPEVIEGLTWTDNDASVEGSVAMMLANFLDEEELAGAYYFGGHRPVQGLFNLRAEGRYVQIHNPRKRVVASIEAGRKIELERDIVELEELSPQALSAASARAWKRGDIVDLRLEGGEYASGYRILRFDTRTGEVLLGRPDDPQGPELRAGREDLVRARDGAGVREDAQGDA
jgi:hypothetical protein